MENQVTGCAGGLHMRLVCLRWANKSKDWLSMGLQTSTTAPKLTTTQPVTVTLTESIDSSCTWTRESRSFRKSHQSWSFRTWFLLRCVQTNQKQSARKNWKEKEAKRSKSAFVDLCMQRPWPLVVHCQSMQVNRCQGGKSSRLCRRTGSFPVVTVTNYSPNRSTLNDCNFVVSWRIELKFVALESWRVPFFYSLSFVAKLWGLKNHPWSLMYLCSLESGRNTSIY